MSNRSLFLRRGWVSENAPLKNGLARFIPQLMRVTIKFCKESPRSSGVREFIESDVVAFAKQNPSCALYLKPRRHRKPVIVAEYLNGEKHHQVVDTYTRQQLKEWLDVIRSQSGKEYQVQLKYEYTDHPSIQGVWNPFTNADPAVALEQHPDPRSLETREKITEISATERVKQMFAEQQARSQKLVSDRAAKHQ